ncbi:hypothetical protein BJY04DRAFT_166891 [Aspergillus karnatakaensis]|uniref:Zn(II)2Cys6 transcription factor domain-containing protein n=1 Tax=Aspergillus karnatakaensis TaxID=1810916 RepID=UPI003CCDA1A2
MNVPRTAEGQSQPQTVETGSGRGKTVTSACERCRRRKIRCDGETPCATCRRFRISCVRIQKNDTHALEQRVRQLEAQIAEFTAISNTQSPESSSISTPQMQPQPWPDIRLITDFGSPAPPVLDHFSQFQPNLSPIEIPSIQVVDYADSISPVSPVSMSPSPMLRPLAPVPPKPQDMGNGLRPPSSASAISPPISACPSPNPLNPYLSPRSVPGPSRSRSSSISSLNLDLDWSPHSSDIPVPTIASPDFDPGLFDMFPPSETETPWTPTRFESETLLDKFFDRTQSARHQLPRYPLDRTRLFEFLDIIHHTQISPGGHGLVCSLQMARFHVYMAMAIGLRMEPEGRSTTLLMLQNCYRLAIEEVRAPWFWSQAFAAEAAVLVMLFAQVSAQLPVLG